jgi:CO dehydrogenase/acetyl-CoA synthase delta subunit
MTARVYRPRPVSVHVDEDGVPAAIGRTAVEALREEWLVEDRWWTTRPLRRRYFELVTADGADRVVFRDLVTGRWFTQRGA